MNPWQSSPCGRERRRVWVQEYDLRFAGWAYRQTEVEAAQEVSWVEWDNRFLAGEYVDDDCLEDGPLP